MTKDIVCTYDEYDKMEAIFQEMYFKANDYVPTMYDLTERIIPNLHQYVIFLFWIDITGYDTEENKEIRRVIRKLLTEEVELVEELPVPEKDTSASKENHEESIPGEDAQDNTEDVE